MKTKTVQHNFIIQIKHILLMRKKGILLGLLLAFFSLAQAQSGVLRGFVLDAQSGNPLSGAIVKLKGNNQGAYSDERGFYNIPNLNEGSFTVVATYIGADPSELEVSFKKRSNYHTKFLHHLKRWPRTRFCKRFCRKIKKK